MRVLLVTHRYPPDWIAGVERYVETVAGSLRARGDVASVLTRLPRDGSSSLRLQCDRQDGVSVYRISGGSPFDGRRFLQEHVELENIFERVVLDAGPDIIHFNHVIDLSPDLLVAAYRRHIPIVLTLHDYFFACPQIFLRKTSGEPCLGPRAGAECSCTCYAGDGDDRLLRWSLRAMYHRHLLRLPARLICPSEFVASYFGSYLGDATRLRVLPNAVSLQATDRPPERHHDTVHDKSLKLAVCGSVSPHKGLHVLIRAIETARLERVELRVLGIVDDHDYLARLREKSEDIPGLSLQFYGGYAPEELPSLIDDVDCLVAPSQFPEAFSLVAHEALVLGIPVIASRLGALSDVIIEGQNGFTFEPMDNVDLGMILRRLIDEPDLLTKLRQGALDSEVLGPDEYAERLVAMYDEARAAEGHVNPVDLDELDALRDDLVRLGCA